MRKLNDSFKTNYPQKYGFGYNEGYNDGYDKALDDFTGEISERILWGILFKAMKREIDTNDGVDKVIDYLQKIKFLLKRGVEELEETKESKALKKLQSYLECEKKKKSGSFKCNNRSFCDNCDICYEQGTWGEHLESIELAIKVLERQIPREAKEIHIDEYICPNCGSENSGCDEGEITDKYCPNCGCKILEVDLE